MPRRGHCVPSAAWHRLAASASRSQNVWRWTRSVHDLRSMEVIEGSSGGFRLDHVHISMGHPDPCSMPIRRRWRRMGHDLAVRG